MYREKGSSGPLGEIKVPDDGARGGTDVGTVETKLDRSFRRNVHVGCDVSQQHFVRADISHRICHEGSTISRNLVSRETRTHNQSIRQDPT